MRNRLAPHTNIVWIFTYWTPGIGHLLALLYADIFGRTRRMQTVHLLAKIIK